MTASELIEELKKADPDAEIEIRVLKTHQKDLKVESAYIFKHYKVVTLYAEDY